MKRREFITLQGGAVMWPFVTHAHQDKRMRCIGTLMSLADSRSRPCDLKRV